MAQQSKTSFLNWLGFCERPDWTKARWLGGLIGTVAGLTAIALAVAGLLTLGLFMAALFGVGVTTGTAEAVRNIGLVLAAFIGAPFIIWRAVVANQQVQVADESLFNEKVSAASTDLSARREVTKFTEEGVPYQEWQDDIARRVVAIDTLEGLAEERHKAAPRIIRLLATHIRATFPAKNLEPSPEPFKRKTPRMDLQAGISAIGRIHNIARAADPGKWRIDLKGCDLDGVSFYKGNFYAANFSGSRMEGAYFTSANCEGAWFLGCLLNYVDFFKANLRGANLFEAVVNRSMPGLGGLSETLSLAERIDGLILAGADISSMNYLGEADKIRTTFGDKDTKLHEDIRELQMEPKAWKAASSQFLISHEKPHKLSDENLALVEQLKKTGFVYWPPFGRNDLALGRLYKIFREATNTNRWPYIDE